MRAQRAVGIARRHALSGSAVLAAAPSLALVSRSLAVATAASAALVTSMLCAAVAMLGSHRRERIHDLILRGSPPALELIRDEVRCLLDLDHRLHVAHALDRALYDGEHWHDYLPASRPPQGVRHLPPNGPLIRQITADLRGERVSPRAVILLSRLIQGGYGAAIYQSGPEWVSRELGRIHFELQSGSYGTRQP